MIPTYNEKDNIKILVPKITDVFSQYDIDGEIIIVDDQSTDGSFDLFAEMAQRDPRLVIINRSGAPSLSLAWHEGFVAATKENVVCIDGDLCHDPVYFPEMLKELERFDLVIGSRYIDDRKIKVMEGKSFIASICSKLGQYSSRLVFGFSEQDTSHSFRMFKKEVFSRIQNKLVEDGNVYLIQFLYEAKKTGAKVVEIPIIYGKRLHGETKLKISKESIRYFKFLFKTLIQRCRGRS